MREGRWRRELPALGDVFREVQDGELETLKGGGEHGGWKEWCRNSSWFDEDKEFSASTASLLFLTKSSVSQSAIRL